MGSATQETYDRIIAGADDLSRRQREIDSKLGEIVPGLRQAIEKSDGPSAETLGAALEHEQAEIEDALELARRVIADLRSLKSDKAFMAQRAVVLGTAARTVNDVRDTLTKRSEAGDTLLEQAEEARKRSLGTAAHAQRGLAQLRMWLRQDENFAKDTHEKADRILFAVFAAVEARDEAALAAQQKAFDLLPIVVRQEDPQRNRERITNWARGAIGKGLGPAVDRELQSEVKELCDKVGELEKRWIAPLAPMQAKVMSALIPEIDPRKAAVAMDVPEALATKVGKLVNDTPTAQLERELETFRKANKLPGSGKEMLAALRRAKLIK